MKIQTFLVIVFINDVLGLYIKPLEQQIAQKQQSNQVSMEPHNQRREQAWHVFKKKLGLTDQKVDLLKSQKDQRATMDLVKRFIKENPKYITVPANAKPPASPFLEVYRGLLAQLKKSNGFLKTSLNFELADKSPHRNLRRTRRKIAVKMVSDMPSEKIDALLKMFNQQHGLDKQDSQSNDEDPASNDTLPEDENETSTDDYPEYPFGVRSSKPADDMYENLWEDEEDPATPTKSTGNSEYASFQDLILQANRNQWQREREETKLHKSSQEEFN